MTIPAPAIPPRSSRIGFIDAARSFAIFGAVLCHVLLVTSWGRLDHEGAKALGNLVFRTCAPLFFILTGVLFEVVYVKKARKDGLGPVARRLAVRAAQCYAGYCIGLLAALPSGRLTVEGFGLALVSAGPAPMVGVLWYYCVFLLAAIPLIALRLRHGPWVLLGFIALIWLAEPVLAWGLGVAPAATPTDFFWGRQLGYPPIGLTGSGQAVWHSMTLIIYGMLLGHVFATARAEGRSLLFNPFTLVTVLGCAAGAAYWAAVLGPKALVYGYLATSMPLRMSNHIAYYLLTLPVALAMLAAMQAIHREDATRPPWYSPVLVLGRRSLVAFTLGNAGVNLIPKGFDPSVAVGLAISAAFMIALVAIMLVLPEPKRNAGKASAAA